MENLKELEKLLDLIDVLVSDGVLEGVTLNKNGDNIVISITHHDEFDDSEVKTLVEEYKNNIDDLDDCLFVNALEDMDLDKKRFDELLNQDTFTEDEAEEVKDMINQSSEVIKEHIKDKIQELSEMFDRF